MGQNGDIESAWSEAIFATARPRTIAALVRRFRDIGLAEDAFQTACLRALSAWPKAGRPRDPVSWLVRVGHNAAVDAVRRDRRYGPLEEDGGAPQSLDQESHVIDSLQRAEYRDDVLRLLFMCSRPELSPSDQLGLALKLVIGLKVERIARAFLVPVKTMEKRLTRAKRKAASGGIEFVTPTPTQRAERLSAVAAMLYLLFNEGYSSADLAGPHGGLCEEAIRLQRLLLRLFPAEVEVMGLLALCLFQHARLAARRDARGVLVPLDRQDRKRWNRAMIDEARVLLQKALLKRRPGPYQIQAAIAAVHCRASAGKSTDWAEIERLYRKLEKIQPSPVVTLNRAVALWKVDGPSAALSLIEPLACRLDGYLYFHSSRARLLEELERTGQACEAYRRALALKPSASEAAFIERRLKRLLSVP